ncbi:MAG: molybdenum cofactor guanylyltransferase [Candidatus Dormibacteria bacterium]
MMRADRVAAPPLTGLILCGGRSRRMGVDKAVLVVDGERLVDRAARRLRAVSDPVLLAPGERPLTVSGCASVPESVAAGPLSGIVSGLRASPHDLTAVVAVDMPWLDAELLALLAAACSTEDDAVVPLSVNGLEPLHAVYARSALPAMAGALAGGRLRMRAVLDDLRVRTIDVADLLADQRAGRFAVNLNCADDLVTLGEAPPAPG